MLSLDGAKFDPWNRTTRILNRRPRRLPRVRRSLIMRLRVAGRTAQVYLNIQPSVYFHPALLWMGQAVDGRVISAGKYLFHI